MGFYALKRLIEGMKRTGSVFLCFLCMFSFQGKAWTDDVLYFLARVRIHSARQWVSLQATGIDLEGSSWKSDGAVETVLSGNEITQLRKQGFEISIVQSDLSRVLRSRLSATKPGSFATGSMGGYFTFSEILDILQDYHSRFPDIVGTPTKIGTSVEGRPIVAVKISDHPNMEEIDEPEILYMSLYHAREPAGMMALMYFFEQLVTAYRNNVREAMYLVDHRQLWFIPVVNPDGYVFNEITNPSGGGLWRKNRRNNGDGSFGVDLNRNFSYAWGHDNNGSSPDPKAENFRGRSPFSEPESYAVRDFVARHKFKLSMNFHSYGGSLLYPWSYSWQVARNWAFEPLAEKINDKYAIGNGWNVLGYLTNGDTDDWLFGERTVKPPIIAYIDEVGSNTDSFWPSRERLIRIVLDNYQPSVRLAWMGDSFCSVDYHWQTRVSGQGPLLKGEIGKMTVTFSNTGLGPSNTIAVLTKSKDPLVRVWSANSTIAPLQPLRKFTTSVGQFSISTNAKTCKAYPVELDLISSDGILLRKENITVYADDHDGCFPIPGN